ncbi:hypothetical protein SASPL_156534 [Salvia splendens]|uniref:Thioredoxin domain-containing protein n=1 Tax=Salvia splendens TaxID=180675 RepID=A0A8X8VWH1_SALSN|nr:hypothetical protein SASPL_156534 [Salvia splendens]
MLVTNFDSVRFFLDTSIDQSLYAEVRLVLNVVVEFGVSWLKPILAEIAKKAPHVIFLKVDADELSRVAKEYKINTLSSFVFFKEGKEIDKVVIRKEDIAAKITLHGGVAPTAFA